MIELLRLFAPRKLKGNHLQRVIDLLTLSDQLRDDRNFIVHGTWAIIEPEGVPTVSSLRTKSDPDIIVTEHFPHIRLQAIIWEIIRTREQLVHLLHNAPGHPEINLSNPASRSPDSPSARQSDQTGQ